LPAPRRFSGSAQFNRTPFHLFPVPDRRFNRHNREFVPFVHHFHGKPSLVSARRIPDLFFPMPRSPNMFYGYCSSAVTLLVIAA
jgi:hypothetical protein